MSSDPAADDLAIELNGIGKAYRQYRHPHQRLWQALFRGRRTFYAESQVLQDITFSVRRGETVGIVGRNGAGKSTLLQIIAGTLQPSTGTLLTRGRIAPLIELGSGFNPELTGRENVVFNGMLLGMSEAEVSAKFDAIAAFADIGDYIEQPVKIYSSGMYARLAFSVAIHVDPDILIVDEILSVGDAAFQRKCMQRFHEIRESGCTILVVAHDEYLVRTICQRCLYLKQGRMVAFGDAATVATMYITDLLPAEHGVPAPVEAAEPTQAEALPIAIVAEQPGVTGGSAERPVPPAQTFCTIESVMLTDEVGQVIDTTPTGSTVVLEFHCRWHGDEIPEQVSYCFNCYNANNIYVCGSTTLMERMAPHPGTRHATVRVTFPSLRLVAGRYHWRVAVNDAQGLLVLAEARAVCPFTVTDDYRSAGIYHMERRWDFVPGN